MTDSTSSTSFSSSSTSSSSSSSSSSSASSLSVPLPTPSILHAEDPLFGLTPQPHPNPNPLWQRRIRSIPHDQIPSRMGEMDITPELLEDYKGHEVFLKERAKHPPHCYRAYDALRLCLIQKIDTVTCGKIVEAYRPCARELRKEKLKRVMALEDERRKMLAAKAKVFEEKGNA